MNATNMMAQCTRRSPKSPISVVAMRAAPPDSAIILPSIVPRATTTAMNPSTLPTPSSNARTVSASGMPAAAPSARETATSTTNGWILKCAIRTISATTAVSA